MSASAHHVNHLTRHVSTYLEVMSADVLMVGVVTGDTFTAVMVRQSMVQNLLALSLVGNLSVLVGLLLLNENSIDIPVEYSLAWI